MTDFIHEYAAKGFNLASDAYENGRPEYPNDAIELPYRTDVFICTKL